MAASSGASVAFHPMLLQRHEAKQDPWLSRAGANFNLGSVWAYYPDLRFLGYSFEASYKYATKVLAGKLAVRYPVAKASDVNVLQTSPVPVASPAEKREGPQAHNPFWDGESSRPASATPNSLSVETSAQGKAESVVLVPEPHGEGSQPHSKASDVINRVEAVTFTALAAANLSKDIKDFHTNCDLAVSAERGIEKKKLAFKDLRRSNNPIVASAVDRFIWQYTLRLGSGPFFAHSLMAGILANATTITAERTIFYRPIAYDLLKKAVTDVQINNMDTDFTKQGLVDQLIKVMQQSRLDHRQLTIEPGQIKELRPVLDDIAQDIIDKKFGFQGALYIMGGGVLIPEDPKQSRINYDHVREVGVSGIAKEAHELQQKHHVGPARTWEARIAAQRSGEGKDEHVAQSATRESLLRQRQALLARGPMHGGVSNDVGRGATGMVL